MRANDIHVIPLKCFLRVYTKIISSVESDNEVVYLCTTQNGCNVLLEKN